MSAGDELRNKWGRGDALALHAISDIVATRNERSGIGQKDPTGGPERDTGDGNADLAPPLDRVAFVLRSLKTQEEFETLRAVYGPRLIVIAAYSPKEERIDHLARHVQFERVL